MKHFIYLVVIIFLGLLKSYSQTIGITSPAVSTSYCAGATVNVVYTITGTFSNSPSVNVFSVELSDANGSFTNTPEVIGTLTSTLGGTIPCTFPSTLLTNNLYRLRISSSNPMVTSADNGANLTVFAITINSPTLGQTSFCQNETFTVNFSQSSCNFVNTPSANVYSVELSNASGSFTNPVVIGTRTAVTSSTISCTIPSTTTPGSGYRVRISTSSPTVTSIDNGSNLTVAATVGTPSIFGTTAWNVYCYGSASNYTNNYRGFYTNTSLSFSTSTRWAAGASPSAANATGGSAFSGCLIGTSVYSYSYKRTNIPCGYYQIDVPTRGNEVTMLINGVTVFESTVCCVGINNVFRDMILSTDNVEIRCSKTNAGGQGALTVNFTRLNEVSMSTPVTICAGTNASLTVTNTGTLPVSFSWAPTASVSPVSGTAVIATPTISTTYTAIGSLSSCATFSGTVLITVNAVPVPMTAVTSVTICNGFSNSTITASGGNTYSWTPAAGLSATLGNVVVASPTVTTLYTVTASNNCSTVNATRNIIVQTIPSTPSPTAFGNGFWNVFCYNSSAFTNLFGYYSENNVNFVTTTRWANSSSPSSANAATGSSYSGCNLTNASHGTISKRTNFTCGYYRVNLVTDDFVLLAINGSTVYTNATAGTYNGVWTGFLGPTSEVELRHANTTGATSSLSFSLVSVPVLTLSPPVTICAGTNATLTAANVSGVNYSWTPSTNLNTTTGTVVIASPTSNIIYTCTLTDTLTLCSASGSNTVTVNALPTTIVSPSLATINCTAQVYTLTASGANTYSWSPSAGLSATTGNSVVASPTINTDYTVTGNNNCASLNAIASISVVPLVNPTVFPTGTWNAYCYSGSTFTSYSGYYTENGSGPSTYDFNTTSRWAVNAAPSTANAVNGNAYLGCTLTSTNHSISFKRRGFICNTYSIHILNNDDNMTLLINGTSVSTRATSAVTAAIWSGVLTNSTNVEIRLTQTTGTAAISVSFVPAPTSPSINVWAGTTSTNWFTSSNWCSASPPSATTDVIIFNSGTSFLPVISATGAACANLTITGAIAAGGSSLAIPAASLTTSGSFALDINGNFLNNGVYTGATSTVNVNGNFTNGGTYTGATSSLSVYGNFVNNGTFNGATSTVNILGSGSKTLSCNGTQNLNVLVINNSGSISVPTGIHRVSNNLNLQSGILALGASTIQLLNAATVSNANASSYIKGTVSKIGNQAFTFPLGDAGFYRPISISAPVVNTDAFTASYNALDPSPSFTHTSKDVIIDHISRCEHWILDRTAGSSIVRVTLSWDGNSCGVTNLSDLLVCRWNGSTWKNQGNGGTTGNTSAGSIISSAPVTAFSPFTLGSRTGFNPLPIQLIDFVAHCFDKKVFINWQTSSEKNNDYFILQKSLDAINWFEFKKVLSKGNSELMQSYECIDTSSFQKGTYYRLIQVDKDNQQEIFKTLYVSCEEHVNEFKFFPNPAKDEIQLAFNVKQNIINGILSIKDQLGNTRLSGYLDLKQGSNLVPLQIMLPAGLYYISYSSAPFSSEVMKLIIIK